jgi:hypothetical protein
MRRQGFVAQVLILVSLVALEAHALAQSTVEQRRQEFLLRQQQDRQRRLQPTGPQQQPSVNWRWRESPQGAPPPAGARPMGAASPPAPAAAAAPAQAAEPTPEGSGAVPSADPARPRSKIKQARGVDGMPLVPEAPPPPKAPEKEVDPSVKRDLEQAKAAHVDLKVFGVALGQPLGLSACSKHPTDEVCLLDMGGLTYVKGLIALPVSLRPQWLPNSATGFEVQGDVLTSFSMIATEDPSLVSDLTKKFGKAKSHTVNFSNAFGKTTRAIELEWTLPGLHVTYSPESIGKDGLPVGDLVIELDTVRRARVHEEESVAAKKIKL